jgi:TRAP-type C4-dicarboxylate transport system permease small subunit
MILITVGDVIGRIFNMPIKGAYDLVQITGVLTIACALPYTTAVKGHVAIEYFYHKLSRTGRFVMDSVIRICAILLFSFLCIQSVRYAQSLQDSNQVTLTLQIPLFWVPWLIAVSSAVVVLVILENLLHPGKEMIKP